MCMNWNPLTDEGQIEEIISRSQSKPQVIFKHSTRCSISAVALQRMQKAKQPDDIDFHFLDLLAHRPLSNKVAEVFGVHHESPQVLLIKDGKCVFDESHLGISMNDLVAEAM